MEKTLGGDRLGSGKKMKVELHNFERSTFNQSRKFISTMAPGLLVPVFREIGTNGDKFEIDIKSAIRTIPTIAPLFGTFKFQCDFFAIPMRLYNGLLHNNAIKIGMKMNQVLFPQIEFTTERKVNQFIEYEKWFSHPSSLINYLGYRDLPTSETSNKCIRNASFIMAYYDIYKNYYANKQEKMAYIIGRDNTGRSSDTINNVSNWYQVIVERDGQEICNKVVDPLNPIDFTQDLKEGDKLILNLSMKKGINIVKPFKDLEEVMKVSLIDTKKGRYSSKWISYDNQPKYSVELPIDLQEKLTDKRGNDMFDFYNDLQGIMSFTLAVYNTNVLTSAIGNYEVYINENAEPQILPFELENIDRMRRDILKVTDLNKCVKITDLTYLPYGALAQGYTLDDNTTTRSKNALPLYGLALKTYQSDMFNNWLANTDNIELVNEISAINTSSGEFTMDALILAKKVYNMLNRIAMSGGTWQDWQEAVYAEEAVERAETPIYCGGASCEIAFEEVVQTGTGENTESLGALGGKGITMKHEGGFVVINCNEPMLIMGIASITPRICYSQGDYWFNELNNLDELHKPSMDGIGFQDLLMSRMVGCTDYEDAQGNVNHYAIGKQTAWLNYQTAIDEAYGNFALENNQMFMTLNRNYSKKLNEQGKIIVDDATTYIDPTKYNYPFAQTDLNAQNFWVQLAFDVKARRKMSAKQIPNL